ncbi:lysine biosynthesis enzyme LysX [Catenulispora acidiphila DSM 44928]|uniref:Lysine biosynthesis enzyme LysX n=1 Tax=Catenulispora acidiphila (strain DSM 44928 / JCM 14897 / NBRC 102108 / NRRL B-24433 / ID139908) TaxID=479433 RepID=C7QK69_CATAD|nr:RimK family alpha-L-glutamate ligase [Catenulispora acidiphila]ACU75143.1 lysine biosynthesis enzyme LysX [Catenulispora acidiphila DSM 44928]
MSATPQRPGESRIAVLASRVGADEKRLFDAFDRRGVPFEHVDTRRQWYVAGHSGGRSFDLALNREIGQVRAAYAARSLSAAGVTVVNSAEATEVCGDKWRTTQALEEAGLPTPRTALALTSTSALEALEVIGYPALIKPLVGSWGRLVVPLRDRAGAEAVLEYVAALPGPQSHLAYVQELIDKPGRDIRAIVVGGEVLGAVYRSGESLRTNVALGGQTRPCEVTPEIAKFSVGAADAVGADIAGVDLIEDRDGRLLVLEVNHRVEFTGFQSALAEQVNVADHIVEHLLERAHR